MTTPEPTPDRNRGVALILVLGLLAILTLMVTGLLKTVRVERLNTRNHLNSTRAHELVQVALAQALRDIEATTTNYCYPYWTDAYPDILVSTGGVRRCSDILGSPGSLASAMLPAAITNVLTAAGNCTWQTIRPVSPDGVTSGFLGRVAYLVANCSGLVDANELLQTNSPLARQLLNHLPDIADPSLFLEDGFAFRRYETVAELTALNLGGMQSPANLFTLSFDPNPNQYFTSAQSLGTLQVELTNRFWVNAAVMRSNETAVYACFSSDAPDAYTSDAAFMSQFFNPLVELLGQAGYTNRPESLAWNLVNYMDGNHIPQTDSPYPWQDESGCEAVPLINEMVLQEVDGSVATVPSNQYEVAIELWFPFYSNEVTAADGFSLHTAVFDRETTAEPETSILNVARPDWSFSATIGDMAFGTPGEYLCFTSPVACRISFPQPITNAWGGVDLVYLPLGPCTYQIPRTNAPPQVVHVTNTLWILNRVQVPGGAASNETRIVDEAMGYRQFDSHPEERQLKAFTSTVAYAVDDPRWNGMVRYWKREGPAGSNSLGRMNPACDPWIAGQGQGLPIIHRDAPLLMAGELGHLFVCERRDDGEPLPWRNVDLLTYRGGSLLDRMTISSNTSPVRGRINLNTRSPAVLMALLAETPIGHVTTGVSTNYPFLAGLDAFARAIQGPYLNLADALSAMGESTGVPLPVFQTPRGPVPMRELAEDAIRPLAERVTFRQNLFTVLLCAQMVDPETDTTLAEERAVAVVGRDAYTGRKWVHRFLRVTD